MPSLINKKCIPCEGGMPPLTTDQIKEYLPQVNVDWQVINDKLLSRQWKFKNFMEAVNFINLVAEIAEQEDHHPDLHLTNYKQLAIELSTHSIGGLSENDFIMAAKIDQLTRN